VSARSLFYGGETHGQPHLSDAGATLYDTVVDPVLVPAGEMVGLAMRSGFALFDKIAFS
jgi:hypothetical protein